MTNDQLLAIFEQTAFNRAFEFEVAKAYDAKRIPSPVYLSVGQEHIPAAIAAVSHDWQIFAQHRAHSYYLSFGGDPAKLRDELLGLDSGCAGGMGGSASIHCPEISMFGHSGLMGDQIPIAVGAALASGRPTLAVMGDASAEEDYVLAAMGFAATKRTPVLFICEDNGLSILTPIAARRSWSMSDVARSLGMPSAGIDDDPQSIVDYVTEIVPQLPAYLNIRTCRHLWHAGTGSDGPPAWNSYEMIKKGLDVELVEEIEHQAQRKTAALWA